MKRQILLTIHVRRYLFVLMIITAAMSVSAQQYTWDKLNSGTGYTLFSSSFADAQTGWAVGGNNGLLFEKQVSGLSGSPWFETVEAVTSEIAWILGDTEIIKTTDGGLTWVKYPGYYNDISFADALKGWSISSFSISKTLNGGESWTEQYSGNKFLNAIYALNDQYCWVAGDEGTVCSTADGGNSWTVQPTGITERLNDIFFISEKTGWAVGAGGVILRTSNGGVSWSKQESGITTDFNSVHFADSIHGGIAADRATILVTSDGGSDWSVKPELKWPPYDLAVIRFTDALNAYAVGVFGTILKTIDGGTTWKSISSGTTAWLNGMDISGESIWIAGNSNTILKLSNAFIAKTSDSGVTWIRQSGHTNSTLFGICATGTLTAYAVGGEGTILKTMDGGGSWVPQNSGVSTALNGLYMADNQTGWIAGNNGTILKSSNGGSDWIKLTTGTTDTLHAVFFKDMQHGYAVGSFGTLLITQDGGTTWNIRSVSVNHLRSVFFINEQTGFICGLNGTLLKTGDGGESWQLMDTNYPNHLFDVRFIQGTGWAAGSGGIILKTDSGGEIWTRQSEVSAEDIFSVSAINRNLAFATGRKGTLLRTSSLEDKAPPVVSLTKPVSGQVILRENEPVQVSGSVDEQRAVACMVNGEYVRVVNGALDTHVAVSPLRNSVVVKAADQAGNITVRDIPLSVKVNLPAEMRKYYLGGNHDLVNSHINSSNRYEVYIYEKPWIFEFSREMTEDLLVSKYGYAISISSGTKAYTLTWLARRNGRMTVLARTTRRLEPAGLQSGSVKGDEHILLQGDTLVFRMEGAYLGGFSWGATSSSGFVTVGSEAGTSLSPPELVAPLNNSVDLPLSFQLKWKKSKGATGYLVEVDDQTDFATPIISFPLQSDTVVQLTDMQYASKYYWRVAAVNASDTSEWSAVWNFTTLQRTVAPTVQASLIIVSEITSNSARISWTPGNGSQSVVFIKEGNGTVPALMDNFTYTAGPVFGTGSNVAGSEWFCVYFGTGSNFTVTGLQPLKSYSVRVFSLNGTPENEKYLNTEAPGNPTGFITECDRDFYGNNPAVHLYYKSDNVYDVEITLSHSCGTTTFKFMDIPVVNNSFTIQVNAWPNSGTMQGIMTADRKSASGSFNINIAYLHPLYGYPVQCGNRTGTWSASSDPCIPSAAGEIISERFGFYPNPACCRIHFEGLEPGWHLFSVFDSRGRLVKRVEGYQIEGLDVQDLPDGIYILRLDGEMKSEGRKFVKN